MQVQLRIVRESSCTLIFSTRTHSINGKPNYLTITDAVLNIGNILERAEGNSNQIMVYSQEHIYWYLVHVIGWRLPSE